MRLGIAYYPEHHPPTDWAPDYEKIRQAGIERIRIAEFAWSALEPTPGVYTWDWLDDSIDQAETYGIEVVLCTPTACPPIWLVEQHPEILPVDRFGRRTGFGARQHRCYRAPAYIEHSQRIVQAMAQRYGAHPNVVAWQLDNEFGGEQKRCYCDICRQGFQSYLEHQYGTLAALNSRWGNHFWSQDYQRWDQIPVPLEFAADLRMRHHPSLELAFSRFSSQSIVEYSRMQVKLLRPFIGARPVTTNAFMFRWGDNVDWYALFRDLDAASIDIYSTSPHEIAFYADFVRSLRPDHAWVLEYGATSPNVRDAFTLMEERGIEWLAIFKLNPVPAGQEQSMESLLTITGEPTPNYHVVQQWALETQRQSASAARPKPDVGLVYDFESSWAYSIDAWHLPYPDYLKYPDYVIHTVYRALFESGCGVEVMSGPGTASAPPLLVAPRHCIYTPELEEALIQYVQSGGQLIVTSDLFHKNTDNAYLTQVPRLYRLLLDWHANAFIESGQEFILRTARFGAGQTWMVRADARLEDWRGIIETIRSTGTR